ncbi:MAG: hypothetical protein JWN41_1713 [Thermoleophilia bacterium]|nr:hypothetical protein [Thermoleophilia bacterium]
MTALAVRPLRPATETANDIDAAQAHGGTELHLVTEQPQPVVVCQSAAPSAKSLRTARVLVVVLIASVLITVPANVHRGSMQVAAPAALAR